ncbi:TetR/AcrR family transcriptional regulator [Streptomyces shenzhenensis]|uniref:TetR/AcrR family transcriptional regulator n=1 Tax=Streptomyces shenzhenensis TaxID=943815 RepID=UPI0015F01220|nr:TetR/AcrR family transcriptional regulator [Streptomyces shenzhenensis]
MTTIRPAAADDVGGDATESKARILRSAQVLFARNGYDGTSLKAIARDVGVSTPALYWHFRSKDEIYLAAIEKMLVDFLEAVRGAVHSSEPLPRFRETVSAHIRFQLERRDEAGLYAQTVGMRRLTADLPKQHRETIVALQRSYVDELRDILRSGRDDGTFSVTDVRTTVFAVVTLCEYVHTWYNPAGPFSVNDVVRQYADMATRMVGACPDPSAARLQSPAQNEGEC